jgi:DNA modification methylase
VSWQTGTIIIGDALKTLRELEAESVQCVVTSPPYWGLRDYGLTPSEWADGWAGCLGLEPTPEQFLVHLVELFEGVKRVLRPDGTVWLNMGDCYAASPRGNRPGDFSTSSLTNPQRQDETARGRAKVFGLAAKQRLMMPARCALALQAAGWWIRSEIVWAKPNPMPSSVTDRPTDSHEMVYLLAKGDARGRARYFYDADAVREKQGQPTRRAASFRDGGVYTGNRSHDNSAPKAKATHGDGPMATGRNRRTVWTIPTQPYRGAHFATFPEKLVEPCILAGTSARGACSTCGAPWRRVVEKGELVPTRKSHDLRAYGVVRDLGKERGEQGANRAKGGHRSNMAHTRTTTGWEPTCEHADAPTRPCVVLDPFCGSGTTGVVALKNGSSFVGLELSRDYAGLALERLQVAAPSLFCPVIVKDDGDPNGGGVGGSR